jgi:hypothetical protein
MKLLSYGHILQKILEDNQKEWEATFFALVWGGSLITKNRSFNCLTFEFIPIHFRPTLLLKV